MRKANKLELDFIVDKLTNSIENAITGDSFATDISVLTQQDLKKVSKKMVGYLIGKRSSKNQFEMFLNLPFQTISLLFKGLLV